MELYICDKARKIADGKCNGISCATGDCHSTTDKKYAKNYISIFDAEKIFEENMNRYIMANDTEKAKQYANALKSIQQVIIDFKKESEEVGNVFVDCLYEQLKLFEEML
ncbi:MAG: hypothetical protein IKF29_07155 [Oceanobacillus sp.]|nr:hypothetical protein [Oceanobacillus sp.]